MSTARPMSVDDEKSIFHTQQDRLELCSLGLAGLMLRLQHRRRLLQLTATYREIIIGRVQLLNGGLHLFVDSDELFVRRL